MSLFTDLQKNISNNIQKLQRKLLVEYYFWRSNKGDVFIFNNEDDPNLLKDLMRRQLAHDLSLIEQGEKVALFTSVALAQNFYVKTQNSSLITQLIELTTPDQLFKLLKLKQLVKVIFSISNRYRTILPIITDDGDYLMKKSSKFKLLLESFKLVLEPLSNDQRLEILKLINKYLNIVSDPDGKFNSLFELLPKDLMAKLINTKYGNDEKTPIQLLSHSGFPPEVIKPFQTERANQLKILLTFLTEEQQKKALLYKNKLNQFSLLSAVCEQSSDLVKAILDPLSPKDKVLAINQVGSHPLLGIKNSNPLAAAFKMGLNDLANLLILSVPEEHRHNVIGQTDEQGDTLLMHAAKNGHPELVQYFINMLPEHEVVNVINIKNTANQSALALAYSNDHAEVVTLLQNHGAQFPKNLQYNQPRTVNRENSTHTGTIHDSTARSAMALVVRYLELTEEERAILSKWAHGKIGDELDIQNHQAVKNLMETTEIQKKLQEFEEALHPEIEAWANKLSPEECYSRALFQGRESDKISDEEFKHYVVKLSILKTIWENRDYVNFKEPRTEISLSQSLALIWKGIHDKSIIELRKDIKDEEKPEEIEKIIQLKRESLIDHIFDAERRLLNNPLDKSISPHDDAKSCAGGFFNELIFSLAKENFHPDVKVIFVNDLSIIAKANQLIKNIFNLQDFNEAEIKQMYQSFVEDYLFVFSNTIKAKLKAKIHEQLYREFGSYEKGKLINPGTIDQATEKAVVLLSEPTIKKICSDLETHYANNQDSKNPVDYNGKDTAISDAPVIRGNKRNATYTPLQQESTRKKPRLRSDASASSSTQSECIRRM